MLNTLKKVKNNLSINNFEKNLYTKNMPNPDILIRTENTGKNSYNSKKEYNRHPTT